MKQAVIAGVSGMLQRDRVLGNVAWQGNIDDVVTIHVTVIIGVANRGEQREGASNQDSNGRKPGQTFLIGAPSDKILVLFRAVTAF